MVTLRGVGNIDQLLRRAVARIEALGLDVYAVIDHSGDAAEAGVTMPETKLVLFGSAKDLTALMLAHPHIGDRAPPQAAALRERRRPRPHQLPRTYDLAHRYVLTEEEADALRVVDAIARQTRSNA